MAIPPYMQHKLQEYYQQRSDVEGASRMAQSQERAEFARMGLGSYEYSNDSGEKNDRHIDFFCPGEPSSLFARVYILSPEGEIGKCLSEIPASEIEVDIHSVMEKVRQGDSSRISIGKIESNQQKIIIQNLDPQGPWKIAVTKGEGGGASHLHIFYSR